MSTAAPRSCLKPPLRNPWVAEDGGESSASSGQQQQQQQQQVAHGVHTDAHRVHDVLAHQYATPFQPPTSSHPAHAGLSVAHSGHGGAHPSHSVAYTVTGAHPVVSVARAAPGVGQHAHGDHGVVHSHTVHSLHITAHPMSAAAHSVHSMPGTLQQPWVDPQVLWSTPALAGVGGGVFTVGGGGEGTCPPLQPGVYGQPHPSLHPLHHVPPGGGGGSSGQASTSGGGWSAPQHLQHHTGVGGWSCGGRGVGVGEGSRCERCHYYCFRAAQAMFVAGIVTGFSLLVAGGVFHRQQVAHLQVLVYIGAMVSLVCVVLLVIFCATNKDHRTRRGGLPATRYPGSQAVPGDPEAVPLRAMDAPNPAVAPADLPPHYGGRPVDGGSSSCSTAAACSGGVVNKQKKACCGAAAPQNAAAPNAVGSANHGPASGEAPHHHQQHHHHHHHHHHLQQTRHPPQQRAEEDCEANQRYNRLWKQPTKTSSEAASKL